MTIFYILSLICRVIINVIILRIGFDMTKKYAKTKLKYVCGIANTCISMIAFSVALDYGVGLLGSPDVTHFCNRVFVVCKVIVYSWF